MDEMAREGSDFWHRRSPAERMAAMELMRQLSYDYDPRTLRMEFVFERVERPDEASEHDTQETARYGRNRRVEALVETLVKEAVEDEGVSEMTPQDWADIRVEALKRLKAE